MTWVYLIISKSFFKFSTQIRFLNEKKCQKPTNVEMFLLKLIISWSVLEIFICNCVFKFWAIIWLNWTNLWFLIKYFKKGVGGPSLRRRPFRQVKSLLPYQAPLVDHFKLSTWLLTHRLRMLCGANYPEN